MAIQYSPGQQTFYQPDWKYSALPGDLLPIADAEYMKAMSRPAGYAFTVSEAGIVELLPPPEDPPASSPASISPAQARIALHNAGPLGQVEAAVAAADIVTQIAWAQATAIERDSPTVAALSAALGLTAAQLDDLFTAAAAIRV
jgi:hypothetical protein